MRALLGGWGAWLKSGGATEPASAPATSLKGGSKPQAKPRKTARRRRS